MPIEKARHERIFRFRGRPFSRGLAAIGLFALAAALWAAAAFAQGSGSTPPANGVRDPRNLGILTPREYPLVKRGVRSASDIVRRAESLGRHLANPEAQSNGSNPRGRDRPPAGADR